MNISLGNLDQHLNAPPNPTAVGQLITPAGNHKFTVHDAVAGTTLGPLAMNIPFNTSYGINQTQIGGGKDSVTFGFCDAAGHWLGTANHDQSMCQITHAQANGQALYWQAKFTKAGNFTFAGGAG